MNDFNLYSVNWQNGMLITQQHLKEQERYFEELARWHAVSVADRYGLVRKSFSGKPALSLNLSVSGNLLRVEVARCQALTPDGSFIEINESTQPLVRTECEVADPEVPVFIGVKGTDKHQVGDPDPDEDVPRVPYLSHEYVLQAGTQPNLPDGSFLQIAKLAVNSGAVTPAADYYPPCVTMYADERLVQKANELRNRLETLLSLSLRAYQAVASEKALPGEKTELQVAFRETMQQLVYYLASTLDSFVVGRNSRHPVELVIAFKRLLRLFSTLLNLQPGLMDYLNEKLFVKVLKSDARRFMSAIDSFLLAEYNHRDLGGHLAVIDGNLDTLRSVLEFVAQVKKDELGPQAVATDMLTYQSKTYRVVDLTGNRLERVGELSYLVIDVAEPRAVTDVVILMTKDMFSMGEWSAMQMRLGLNEARGLGETDPIDADVVTFGNKVALHPKDMLRLPSVNQFTIMFRGAGDPDKLSGLGPMDLQVYAV